MLLFQFRMTCRTKFWMEWAKTGGEKKVSPDFVDVEGEQTCSTWRRNDFRGWEVSRGRIINGLSELPLEPLSGMETSWSCLKRRGINLIIQLLVSAILWVSNKVLYHWPKSIISSANSRKLWQANLLAFKEDKIPVYLQFWQTQTIKRAHFNYILNFQVWKYKLEP